MKRNGMNSNFDSNFDSKSDSRSDDVRGEPRRPSRSRDQKLSPKADSGAPPKAGDNAVARAGGATGKTFGKASGKASDRTADKSRSGPPRAKEQRPTTRRLTGPLDLAGPVSDRPAQVGVEIRRALQAEIARGLNDPRVQGMISITEVSLTPDFAEARIRVSVIPAEKSSLTVSGLRAAAGHLRRRVMDETRISRVPRLLFELDERLKRESALDAVIRATGSHTPEQSGIEEPIDASVDVVEDKT